ncbi:MAG: ABC transporter permease, partial [Sneathiella sp.]|nr:ABC transporter permease [Sneathiella sp.]
MLAFTIRRLSQSVVVLFVMSIIVFAGVYAIGNPVDILINPEADIAEQEETMRRLGLDKPMWVQYGLFLSNALKGDLGNSFVHNTPALEIIFSRLPATLELAVLAVGLAIVIGVPLGMIAGLRHDSFIGKTIMTGSILGFS